MAFLQRVYRDWRYRFLFVYLLSLFIRLLYILAFPDLTRDSYEYINTFNMVHDKDGQVYPMLFSYSIYYISLYSGIEIIYAGLLFNIIIGSLIPVIAMYLAQLLIKDIFFELCVGTMLATHPSLIEYSCQIQRETPYICFALLGIIFLIKGLKHRSTGLSLLSGFTISISTLFRYEGLELIALIVILYMILIYRNRTAKRLIILFSSFATGFLSSIILVVLFKIDQNIINKTISMAKRIFTAY